MTSYLLDTCAWIDALLAPEKLNSRTREIINSQNLLYLSSISLIELARKEADGDIELRYPRLTLLNHDPNMLIESTLKQPFRPESWVSSRNFRVFPR